MGRSLAGRPAIAVTLVSCLIFQGCARSFRSLETDLDQGSDGMAVAIASSLQRNQVVRITTREDRFEATFVALEGNRLRLRDKVYPFGGKYARDRERLVYELDEIQRVEVAAGRNAKHALVLAAVLVLVAVGFKAAFELNPMGSR